MTDLNPTPSLAFIVPALNEQDNLEQTISDILRAADGRALEYQVLIFNDGSTDATATLADRLAAGNPRIQAYHNQRTMGLGYNYFHGVRLAGADYVAMIPADHEIPEPAIRPMLDLLGQADLIVPHILGSEARPLLRRVVSRAFVVSLNLLFGLRLKYYNGPCILRRDLVLRSGVRTSGFAYMAAILVLLIRSGYRYVEVGIPLQYRRHGRSKAVSAKNILSVLRTVAGLLWRVYGAKSLIRETGAI